MDEIKKLAGTLAGVIEHASRLGLFTDDRDLLECPQCGLQEDVSSDGCLITYGRNSEGYKDSGLRFSRIHENVYKCPACGVVINQSDK